MYELKVTTSDYERHAVERRQHAVISVTYNEWRSDSLELKRTQVCRLPANSTLFAPVTLALTLT